jgi:hypothetical protein
LLGETVNGVIVVATVLVIGGIALAVTRGSTRAGRT